VKRQVALAASALCLAGLPGCGSSHKPLPKDPATLLAEAAGHLDDQTTFRLVMDMSVPSSQLPPTPYSVKLSGLWSTIAHTGDMAGTLKGVPSTVLSAQGVEYVSLAKGATPSDKPWLKVDDDGMFGVFDDPHTVSQVLRAYKTIAPGKDPRTLTGTIATAEADTHIADPNLIAALGNWPDTVRFDVAVDQDGEPTSIVFHLQGDSSTTTGTVQLEDFGAKVPTLSVPTADQVEEAPANAG
jgi:hypothetical protein